MKEVSYQHSPPKEEDSLLPDITVYDSNDEGRRGFLRLSYKRAIVLGVLFVLALAAFGGSNDSSDDVPLLGAPRGSATKASSKHASKEEAPKPKEVDWDTVQSKGEYDWQKCVGTVGPDCWAKEGQRVGSYWHDFGEDTKTYWVGYGQRMRDFWTPKHDEELLGAPLEMEAASKQGPPKPKDFDWDKIKEEGDYDWQKCQGSDDPDCWENEAHRVNSYWHDFGESMKTYWTDFGKRTRDFWSPKKAGKKVELLGSAKDKPMPDWEKCKASKDPSCWKTEGKSFGKRMKSYWKNLWSPKKKAGSDDATKTADAPGTDEGKET
jgi:hypothetical protein